MKIAAPELVHASRTAEIHPSATHADRELRETLHRKLLDAPFDPSSLGRDELRARLSAMLREEAPLLAAGPADSVLDALVDDVGGLGALEPLLADASITEIMVNGADRVYVERAGRIEPVPCRLDEP